MRDENEEQPFHPIYNYALITDSREGLILTDVNTLADGNPRNNQLRRALTWNPNGLLKGARHLTIGGHYVYVAADAGLVILESGRSVAPASRERGAVAGRRASALQFRYLFVTDREGLKVLEITDKRHPRVVEQRVSPGGCSQGLSRPDLRLCGRRQTGPGDRGHRKAGEHANCTSW